MYAELEVNAAHVCTGYIQFMFMSYMYCFTMINDWLIHWSYLFQLMILLYMYPGDGAASVTTMLSLVAPRVVFVTACGATGRCRVVTLTAPLCSSVYTLQIYMPSDRGQGRHVYVIYVLLYYYWWLIGWSSLFRLMPVRNMHSGDGAVGVTTMMSLVVPLIVFVTACGANGRCGVVALTAPFCSSVYTLRYWLPYFD